MTRAAAAAVLLVILATAATLRLVDLDRRLVHGDEAVQAAIVARLLETGEYRYDPAEFHGPTLPYLARLSASIAGAASHVGLDMTFLRVVPALFGIGIVVLMLLARRFTGSVASFAAAGLAACSPALVFYSRDFVHEMLLAFLSLASALALARHAETGARRWALMAGVGAGLMLATKETAAIAFLAAGAAAVGVALWNRRATREGVTAAAPWRGALAWAAVGLGATLALAFTSFFTDPGGVAGAWAWIPVYLERAGTSIHVQPWSYYIQLLAYTHLAPGPHWSEGSILLLAAVGLVAIVRDRLPAGADRRALRFLAIYAIAITALYSAIPYKTPWCLVQFLWPCILLAGVGVAALLSVTRGPLRVTVVTLVVAAAIHLGVQAKDASFRFHSDPRNPYVYAHPVSGVERLAGWLDRLAAVDPDGQALPVQVIADNYWPLPWYLRHLSQVGYWTEVPDSSQLRVPVVVVESTLAEPVERALGATHRSSHYGLRPDVVLVVFVEESLWQRFVASQEGSG